MSTAPPVEREGRCGRDAQIGRLFSRLDLLAPESRIRLSELLAVHGAVPALLPDDIAGLPLPGTTDGRRAVRAVIEDGVSREVQSKMSGSRLAEIVPPIAGHDGAVAAAGCPARLRDTLRRQGCDTWAELGRLTLGEIGSWTNVGPLTLATLLGMAVEIGLTVLAGETEPAPTGMGEEAPAAEAADLAVLLAYDAGELRSLLDRAVEQGPAIVRAAASRLLTQADRSVDPRLRLLDDAWARLGDHRARGVLVHRALWPGRRLTIAELACALGVSTSRVGQIEARARSAADDAVASAPAALRQLADDVNRHLGPGTTRAAVDVLLKDRRLPGSQDPRAMLLLWAAGPYHPVPGLDGWLASDPQSLMADTRRLLHDDGGVRPLEEVRAELERAGVAAALVDDWLAAQPVTVVDGLVVVREGSPADGAERVLSATGRAMTAAEVATALDPATGGDAIPAMADRLRRDRRFVRVSADTFELAEWGSAPFEPPGSVRPELFPGAGGTSSAGTWWLRIEVDRAVLRGTDGPVPVSLVEALGVARGARRTFTTRFGPVAIVHQTAEPTRGSIRPVALAAGAQAGDTLVLGFDAVKGAATVELVSASASAAS